MCLNSPHFIGTMNPTRKPSNADLQLRQSFRWVLLSPSLEPVSGLLSRHLRHGLTQLPREGGTEKMEALRRVVEWLPSVWEHVNKTVSQSACIGQLSCLMHSSSIFWQKHFSMNYGRDGSLNTLETGDDCEY